MHGLPFDPIGILHGTGAATSVRRERWPREWVPNYNVLGIARAEVLLSALREQWIKPLTYVLLGVLLALLVLGEILARLQRADAPIASKLRHAPVVVGATIGLLAVGVAGSPGLLEHMTMRRFTLDANHFWVASCGAHRWCGGVEQSPGWAAKPHPSRLDTA